MHIEPCILLWVTDRSRRVLGGGGSCVKRLWVATISHMLMRVLSRTVFNLTSRTDSRCMFSETDGQEAYKGGLLYELTTATLG
jgi:hypothetical protein